jgi:predicted AAA+ superfamily ATPase
MKIKEILKEIIIAFHHAKSPQPIKRNISLPLDTKKVISVIGVRRSGKTYLLFDTINQLLNNDIAKNKIVYINFEDERLILKQDELDLILQAYRELYPDVEESEIYFFFDEIQNIIGWEKFVRRIHDTITTNIYITGSNAAFLSKDIATSLRGRNLNYEVFPYSFDEYLRHLNIDSNIYLPKNKAIVINHYYKFLENGGFPESINADSRLQSEILRNYFYVMLYKDLIERYNISSTTMLKHFIEKLLENVTNPHSINKIYNDLKSQGYKLSKNLLYELSSYVENIYLLFRVSKFDFSHNKRQVSNKKSYCVDNGLLNTLILNFSKNYGKLLENAVYLYLKQNNEQLFDESIFYHNSNHKECDFILFNENKVATAIQVSHDITDDKTKKREIDGLLNAMSEYQLTRGVIITSEQEETISLKDHTIEVLPAYKVLMKQAKWFG